MPNVNTPPRSESNGDVTTYFIGVIGSTSATYTYPTNQDVLRFINRSVSSSMTLTVNGINYTVPADSSLVVYAPFTSYTVIAQTDSQAFDATATARLSDDVQLTGSNVKQVTMLPLTNVGVTLPYTVAAQPPTTNKTLRLRVKGTGTFTLQVQGTMDGDTFTLRVWDNTNGGFLTGNNIVANGFYDIDVQGYDNVQPNLTALSGAGANIIATGRWLAA